MSFVVAKVGGSLFDLADLTERLCDWATTQGTTRLLLVAGGGRFVDEIRRLDAIHEFGLELSHWMAIRAMCFNSEWLSQKLSARFAASLADAGQFWSRNQAAIADVEAFCRDDESSVGRLPHSWDVTSDSIAARIAVSWCADRLVLLKSAPPPGPVENWARAGYCDTWMTRVLAGSSVAVSAVNLREINP